MVDVPIPRPRPATVIPVPPPRPSVLPPPRAPYKGRDLTPLPPPPVRPARNDARNIRLRGGIDLRAERVMRGHAADVPDILASLTAAPTGPYTSFQQQEPVPFDPAAAQERVRTVAEQLRATLAQPGALEEIVDTTLRMPQGIGYEQLRQMSIRAWERWSEGGRDGPEPPILDPLREGQTPEEAIEDITSRSQNPRGQRGDRNAEGLSDLGRRGAPVSEPVGEQQDGNYYNFDGDPVVDYHGFPVRSSLLWKHGIALPGVPDEMQPPTALMAGPDGTLQPTEPDDSKVTLGPDGRPIITDEAMQELINPGYATGRRFRQDGRGQREKIDLTGFRESKNVVDERIDPGAALAVNQMIEDVDTEDFYPDPISAMLDQSNSEGVTRAYDRAIEAFGGGDALQTFLNATLDARQMESLWRMKPAALAQFYENLATRAKDLQRPMTPGGIR